MLYQTYKREFVKNVLCSKFKINRSKAVEMYRKLMPKVEFVNEKRCFVHIRMLLAILYIFHTQLRQKGMLN